MGDYCRYSGLGPSQLIVSTKLYMVVFFSFLPINSIFFLPALPVTLSPYKRNYEHTWENHNTVSSWKQRSFRHHKYTSWQPEKQIFRMSAITCSASRNLKFSFTQIWERMSSDTNTKYRNVSWQLLPSVKLHCKQICPQCWLHNYTK